MRKSLNKSSYIQIFQNLSTNESFEFCQNNSNDKKVKSNIDGTNEKENERKSVSLRIPLLTR